MDDAGSEAATLLHLLYLCWCNYNQNKSSVSMGSAIVLQLFQTSIENHNLIYKSVITDVDNSTHQSIINHNAYGKYDVTVTRINCVNHMLRRLSTNLKKVSKFRVLNHKINLKKAIIDAGVRTAEAVKETSRYWNSTHKDHNNKLQNMKEDIENMAFHALGQHRDCREHYCKKKPETNYVIELMKLNI